MKNKNLLNLTVIFVLTAIIFSGFEGCGGTAKGSEEDGKAEMLQENIPEVIDEEVLDLQQEEVNDFQQEEIPSQGKITFIIKNLKDKEVYINWNFNGINIVEGERTTGGAWDPINYWTPFCMMDCASSPPNGDCCIECAPPIPRVRKIDSGKEVSFEWEGKYVYKVDDTYCNCPCYRELEATAMSYRAKACVYESFSCFSDPCTANNEGVIMNAAVSGDPICGQTQFDIPYNGTEIVIEIK